jgi:hypothetical protein
MLGDWGWIETETRNLECPGPKDMRVKLYHTDLGGGFKHFDYLSISYMGCHPSH